MRAIHGVEVHGDVIDDNTRCSHYHGDLDIIAIKFKCCGHWFPCRECHDAWESHATRVWPKEQFNTAAILCGVCGHQLAIEEYLSGGSACTACGASLNPRCAGHYHLYFET